MDENLENIWKTFNTIIDFIKFSDTKAAVILATNGVILSIIYTNISKFLLLLHGNNLTIIVISLIIGVILSLISIVYSIRCLAPITDNDEGNLKNLIYFKNIKSNFSSSTEYSKCADKFFMNESKMKDQLFEQIFVNAQIATKKFEMVKHAVRFIGLAIFFLVLPIVVYVIVFLYTNLGVKH